MGRFQKWCVKSKSPSGPEAAVADLNREEEFWRFIFIFLAGNLESCRNIRSFRIYSISIFQFSFYLFIFCFSIFFSDNLFFTFFPLVFLFIVYSTWQFILINVETD